MRGDIAELRRLAEQQARTVRAYIDKRIRYPVLVLIEDYSNAERWQLLHLISTWMVARQKDETVTFSETAIAFHQPEYAALAIDAEIAVEIIKRTAQLLGGTGADTNQ